MVPYFECRINKNALLQTAVFIKIRNLFSTSFYNYFHIIIIILAVFPYIGSQNINISYLGIGSRKFREFRN